MKMANGEFGDKIRFLTMAPMRSDMIKGANDLVKTMKRQLK